MTSAERIKDLCKQKGVPVYKLEQACGFANGYIRSLKKDSMPADRAAIVAEYLGVPMEYIISGEMPERESITGKKYYFSDETAEIAQEVFDSADLRLLFEAARGSKTNAIRLAAEMLRQMKDTNPDG